MFNQFLQKGEFTNEFLLNFNGINYLEDVDVLIHCAARVHQMKENKDRLMRQGITC